MPAYLVAVYTYSDRIIAERDADLGRPGVLAETTSTEVHDTPPLILAGLVKGGCFSGLTEWFVFATRDMLCLAADGRIVNSYDAAKAAEARGALPMTWYFYSGKP